MIENTYITQKYTHTQTLLFIHINDVYIYMRNTFWPIHKCIYYGIDVDTHAETLLMNTYRKWPLFATLAAALNLWRSVLTLLVIPWSMCVFLCVCVHLRVRACLCVRFWVSMLEGEQRAIGRERLQHSGEFMKARCYACFDKFIAFKTCCFSLKVSPEPNSSQVTVDVSWYKGVPLGFVVQTLLLIYIAPLLRGYPAE